MRLLDVEIKFPESVVAENLAFLLRMMFDGPTERCLRMAGKAGLDPHRFVARLLARKFGENLCKIADGVNAHYGMADVAEDGATTEGCS